MPQEIPITIIPEKEKAILVGVEFSSFGNFQEQYSQLPLEESLAELALLAEAAGAEVLFSMQQKRSRPDGALFVGKGLAENIAAAAAEAEADLVIFDDELTGSQLKNLEQLLKIRIIDRTALILDIFAQRAKSKEGQLQVELAQLQYRLPRLTGSSEQLSRLAGGIGTRGPGESKLESDRRYIRKRIHDIESRLQKVKQHRAILNQGRQTDVPTVALIGYTNSGKSTLRYRLCLQAAAANHDLTGEDAGTDMLFATLDSTVRRIDLPDGQQADFSDTVGFIQKLPHQLVSAFKSTLEEVVAADLLLHIVDLSHPNYEQQIAAVAKVLHELGADDKPLLLIANKTDLLSPELCQERCLFITQQSRQQFASGQTVLPVSAKTGQGIAELLQTITTKLASDSLTLKMLLPFTASQKASWLHNNCRILASRFTAEGEYVEVVLPQRYLTRFLDFIQK